MFKSRKKLKIFILITFIAIFSLFIFGGNIKNSIKSSLNDNNVIKYKFFKDLIKVVSDPRYIMNDYNVNFLPKTQFLELDSYKFKINKEAKYPHFVETVGENILIISNDLNFYIKNIKDINFEDKNLQFKKINNKLQNLGIKDILDSKFYDEKLYISYKKIINENCTSVAVASAIFNL